MKAVKRTLRPQRMKKEIVTDFTRVINDTNSFLINIYNFIKIYCLSNPKHVEDVFTVNNIYNIFLILRDGEQYAEKTDRLYQFYSSTFEKTLYFNPYDSTHLLNGFKLGQIMKNNIGIVLSSIKNNVIYNFDRYLFRFVKTYVQNLYVDEIKYYGMIKKCSLYESYSTIDKKIINALKK